MDSALPGPGDSTTGDAAPIEGSQVTVELGDLL